MFRLSDPARAQVESCVHCGLCLEACPTYRQLGIEDDSPRGRIHLIRGLHAGQLEPTEKCLEHLELCLGCRACESSCPSGVKYGLIIEDARSHLHKPGWLERFFLRSVFPKPARLRALARGLRLAQRLRLDRAAIKLRLVPKHVVPFAEVARVPDQFGTDMLPAFSAAAGEARYRVAFVQGCVTDVLFGPTNAACVRVLTANGCDVMIPPAQTCCGALAIHTGDAETARRQARQNVAAFLATGAEYIIVAAAGCGSTLKEYQQILGADPAVREFTAKMRDITEFLGAIDLVPPTHEVPLRVAYQDACHLAHGQGIRLAPRKLLQQIPGLELVPLPESDSCCGSAGIYNVTHPEMASALLEKKIAQIRGTGASAVAAANPGCILQLRAGARQGAPGLQVLHVIDLLDRAYGGGRDDRG